MKTQLKKEQLETEIEILENKAKLKRHELKTALSVPPANYEYEYRHNRVPSNDAIRAVVTKPPVQQQIKHGYSYEDVSFIILKKNVSFTGLERFLLIKI